MLQAQPLTSRGLSQKVDRLPLILILVPASRNRNGLVMKAVRMIALGIPLPFWLTSGQPEKAQ